MHNTHFAIIHSHIIHTNFMASASLYWGLGSLPPSWVRAKPPCSWSGGKSPEADEKWANVTLPVHTHHIIVKTDYKMWRNIIEMLKQGDSDRVREGMLLIGLSNVYFPVCITVMRYLKNY